jgi:hypothetical protein
VQRRRDRSRRALQAAPDYADAIFNLALLLQRGSRHKETAEYWRQYLANDAYLNGQHAHVDP